MDPKHVGPLHPRRDIFPRYCGPSEVRAYERGHSDGVSGLRIQYHKLATTWPNAYHRGYWEGVYDREYRAQQGERDSV